MSESNTINYEEFLRHWEKGGLLTVIPAAIIFILGFSTVYDQADKRAIGFAQASQFHEIAVNSYRSCNRTVFDSKEQCLAASVQLAEQNGANKDITKQLASDLLRYADHPSPSAWGVFKAGLFYFSTEE